MEETHTSKDFILQILDVYNQQGLKEASDLLAKRFYMFLVCEVQQVSRTEKIRFLVDEYDMPEFFCLSPRQQDQIKSVIYTSIKYLVLHPYKIERDFCYLHQGDKLYKTHKKNQERCARKRSLERTNMDFFERRRQEVLEKELRTLCEMASRTGTSTPSLRDRFLSYFPCLRWRPSRFY